MGCCLECLPLGDLPDQEKGHQSRNTPASDCVATPQELHHLHDVNIVADPWQYASMLTVDHVEQLLNTITFEECQPFIAPIKYAKVIKVYDGDTIHIAAPIFEGVVSRFKVRFARIDAPELRTKDEWEKKAGYIARDILAQKIDGRIVELTHIKYDKYGRLLCDVLLDGVNINDWLLEEGWACEYNGRGEKKAKKVNWKSKALAYERLQNHEK